MQQPSQPLPESLAKLEQGALAIELRHISKRFGSVVANHDICLQVTAGTIHGIVGENGAGKSTLMSILYGFYQADSGEILIDGQPATIHNSQQAIACGIGMVHQHFMLVETFTVLENVMLGAESSALLRHSRRQARQALGEIAARYGLAIDPDSVVGELPVGMQQRVEILKALYRGARILILDEPTGVLTPQEAEQLFAILHTLRAQGVTILLITHKLKEIMAITDAVSVMRRGEMVAHCRTAETSPPALAELMVGRKVLLRVDKAPGHPGEVCLRASHLSYRDPQGVWRLKDVSFALRAGEILGIAGVSGNGQSQLLEVLAGTLTPQIGELTLTTQKGNLNLGPKDRRDARQLRQFGVAHVPEDRLRQGLVKSFSAAENAILGYQYDAAYGRRSLDPLRVENAAQALMQAHDVRPPQPSLKTANFSGGNQQKLILAREMSRQPQVLLVGQPTRGVDIGAIEFIHRNLIAARDAGAAVLLVSVELDEIMALADRILVMVDGAITGEVKAAQTNERELGLLMTSSQFPERASQDGEKA
ncbi:MAG: ABC transporter ATP-binding protein [Plesiomonas shigelloides]